MNILKTFAQSLRRKLHSDRFLILFLGFLLPVLSMLCIFAGNQIYPFGDRSFLRTDLYHQYAPFFAELARKLKEGGSLFYTWDIGMGTNFLSLIGYYLSSIFNGFLIFCPKQHILEFVSYLVIFKIGLAGLSFSILLDAKHTQKQKLDFKIPLFSMFYALSGYLAAYSWNVMWLDCIWLTPLILLGLERLVYQKKYLLYTLTLAMAILSNYYIAIMLCMFCVLYFLVLLPGFSARIDSLPEIPTREGLTLRKRKKKADSIAAETETPNNSVTPTDSKTASQNSISAAVEIGNKDVVSAASETPETPSRKLHRKQAWISLFLRFAGSSLMAGALSAVILIPEIKALGLTASSNINFPTEWNSYFSILEMLARHLMDVATETGLDHWPNLYCGVAVLLCLPLYYANKKVALSDKITRTVLLFFFLFSFSVNVPNFIWHGFHYPNSLPCRQSFLYIALLLIMCYEGVQNLAEVSEKKVGLAFAAGTAFILICESIITDDAFTFDDYWVSLLFLGIYAVILLLYLRKKLTREILFVALLVVALTESTMNMAITSVTTVSRSEYLNYTEPYQELIERAQQQDPDFYRFEKVARKTKNDGAFVGYPSLSTFSSVSYGAVSDFYERLGMESSMNAYSNNGITPLMNAIFNVKYILTTTAQDESQLMTLYEQNEDCYLYQNLYALSVGFMLPKGFNLDWDTSYGNAIELQNEFSVQNGGDTLFYEIFDCTESGSDMEISVNEPCHVFVQLDNSSIENVTADIGGTSKTWSHTNRGFLLDLGYCSPEDNITLNTSDDTSFHATAYYLNEDALIRLLKDLQEEQLQVTSYSDTRLQGTIDVQEDGLFFLSIPYDPGWNLYVDGEKAEYYTFQDAFICLDLKAGTHEISMRYLPDGLLCGTVISFAALLLLLGFEVSRRHPDFRSHLLSRKRNP